MQEIQIFEIKKENDQRQIIEDFLSSNTDRVHLANAGKFKTNKSMILSFRDVIKKEYEGIVECYEAGGEVFLCQYGKGKSRIKISKIIQDFLDSDLPKLRIINDGQYKDNYSLYKSYQKSISRFFSDKAFVIMIDKDVFLYRIEENIKDREDIKDVFIYRLGEKKERIRSPLRREMMNFLASDLTEIQIKNNGRYKDADGFMAAIRTTINKYYDGLLWAYRQGSEYCLYKISEGDKEEQKKWKNLKIRSMLDEFLESDLDSKYLQKDGLYTCSNFMIKKVSKIIKTHYKGKMEVHTRNDEVYVCKPGKRQRVKDNKYKVIEDFITSGIDKQLIENNGSYKNTMSMYKSLRYAVKRYYKGQAFAVLVNEKVYLYKSIEKAWGRENKNYQIINDFLQSNDLVWHIKNNNRYKNNDSMYAVLNGIRKKYFKGKIQVFRKHKEVYIKKIDQ